jgi:hypothetical protein
VAEPHDAGNGLHRQAAFVGGPDGLVALVAQVLGLEFKRVFALGVVLGKGCQAGSDVRGLALSSGDASIV